MGLFQTGFLANPVAVTCHFVVNDVSYTFPRAEPDVDGNLLVIRTCPMQNRSPGITSIDVRCLDIVAAVAVEGLSQTRKPKPLEEKKRKLGRSFRPTNQIEIYL